MICKIILFLFVLILPFAGSGQKTTPDCTIIAAKGVVRLAQSRQTLKSGARLGRQDSVVFQKADDFLVVVDKQRRNFVVKPKDKSHLQSASWSEMLAAVGTRSGKILNYVDFQRFLSGRRWLVLGDTVSLDVGSAAFPLDEAHFFYVRYRWTGDTTAPVNKRLPQQGQEVVFSKEALFKVDGSPVSPESVSDFTLFYFDSTTQKSLEIGPFDIVFPEDAVLKVEITAIASHFGHTTAEQEALRKAVEAYLTEAYGEAEKEDFEAWWKAQ